jgi:hypothetical protein
LGRSKENEKKFRKGKELAIQKNDPYSACKLAFSHFLALPKITISRQADKQLVHRLINPAPPNTARKKVRFCRRKHEKPEQGEKLNNPTKRSQDYEKR